MEEPFFEVGEIRCEEKDVAEDKDPPINCWDVPGVVVREVQFFRGVTQFVVAAGVTGEKVHHSTARAQVLGLLAPLLHGDELSWIERKYYAW